MTEEIDINKVFEHPTPTGPVKITFARPPVWDSVCLAFGIIPETAIFTYGDKIHNPNMMDLYPHLIEHEKVHMHQQNFNDEDAAIWWGKFLRDPQFRVDQEAQAYAAQYDFICTTIKDRNRRNTIKLELAGILAGPLYHNTVSRSEAVALIKKYAKTR